MNLNKGTAMQLFDWLNSLFFYEIKEKDYGWKQPQHDAPLYGGVPDYMLLKYKRWEKHPEAPRVLKRLRESWIWSQRCISSFVRIQGSDFMYPFKSLWQWKWWAVLKLKKSLKQSIKQSTLKLEASNSCILQLKNKFTSISKIYARKRDQSTITR